MNKQPTKLNRSITIIIPIFLVIAVFISMLVFQNASVQREQDRTYEMLQAASDDQTKIFDTILANQFAALEIFERIVEDYGGEASEEALAKIHVMKEGTDFTRVWICDSNGRACSEGEESIYVEDRDYFKAGMEGKRGFDIVNSRTSHKPLFIVSVPIETNEGNKGIVFASVDRDVFREKLASDSYGSAGYSFVCDGSGRIVIGTEYEDDEFEDDNIFIILKDADFTSGSYTDLRKNIEENKAGIISYIDEKNRHYYAALSPLGQKDWVLIAVVDSEFAEQSIYEIMRNGYTLIFVIMLIAAAFVLFIFYLSSSQKAKLKYEAEHNHLTGLYNRKAFTYRANQILDLQEKNKYVIICMDVENFKVVNDQFGHEEGDRLLVYIAEYVSGYMERRLGGIAGHDSADVFLAICHYDRKMLMEFVKTTEKTMEEYDLPFNITIRFGFYVVRNRELNVSDMIDRAMMTQGTVKGRADVHAAYYDESIRARLLREQEIVGDMEKALEEEQFELYLQPQYHRDSDRIVSAEALVRWNHPDKGLIMPDEFIDVFEKNGFIVKLDYYVWEKACQILRRWKDEGITTIPISVNVSRADIYEPGICEKLYALVRRYELEPEMLRLEITESAYSEAPEQFVEVIKNLRICGFFIEMDDFGKGYSSLNSLKDIPIDLIKLDLRFLSTSDDGSKGGIILGSVIRMAQWLGIPVIAEGVETIFQADYLRSIGCSVMQGYFFAKPAPLKDFEELLNRKPSGILEENEIFEIFSDSASLWNVGTIDAVIFNRFVGAAGIFEYHNGKVQALRLNDRYFEITKISRENQEKYNSMLLDVVHPDDKHIIFEMMHILGTQGGEIQRESRWRLLDEEKSYIWLSITAKVIAKSGERFIVYCDFKDVTALKAIQEERDRRSFQNSISARLEERLQRDRLHGTLAERVFRLLYDAQDVERAIHIVLETLGDYYDFGRAYIFEDSSDHNYFSMTFEWHAPEVSSQKERLQGISYQHDRGGAYRENFDKGGVFYCSDIRTLPKVQYDVFAEQDIYSLMQVAIVEEGEFCGFIGFDNCKPDNLWTEEEIETLTLVSKLLGAFLMKKRKSEEAAFSSDFKAAIDSFSAFTYIIDPESFEIIYTNIAAKKYGTEILEGEICHVRFCGLSAPCENCPAKKLFYTGRATPSEIRRNDGSWVLSEASNLHWNGRDMLMICCTDITEYKNNEAALYLRTEEYRIAAEQSGKYIQIYDFNTKRISRSYNSNAVFGISQHTSTPEEVVASGGVEGESIDVYLNFYGSMIKGEKEGKTEFTIKGKEGGSVWIRGDYTMVYDDTGKPSRAVIIFADITNQKKKELAYEGWQKTMDFMLAESTVYCEGNLSRNLIIQRKGDIRLLPPLEIGNQITDYITYWAENFTFREDVGEYRDFVDPARLLMLYIKGVTEDTLTYRMEIDGQPFWYRIHVKMMEEPYSDDIMAYIVFTDIDREKEEQLKLAYMAAHDYLTGLYNRGALEEQVNSALSEGQDDEYYALFMLDMDDFKKVNDSFGHQEGDSALIKAAEAISSVFRQTDVCARLGGDEFMVFMRGAKMNIAKKRVESLMEALKQSSVGNTRIPISCSIGIAIGKGENLTFERLYKMADAALYTAKTTGKNRYHILELE